MNESVKHLVDAIAAGDALETEKAFASAMAEKLSVKLDDMRAQVAQNMFKTEEETVVEEETSLEESKNDPAHAFAKEVVKNHPHLRTVKDPDNKGHHIIMHKHDEDGSEAGGMIVHHKDGKIHISHEGTAVNDAPEHHSGSAEEMHSHASKIAKAIPKKLY